MEIEPDSYCYWLEYVEIGGMNGYHGPILVTVSTQDDPGTPNIPLAASLKRIFPNPFNPSTSISFEVSSADLITIAIFNM